MASIITSLFQASSLAGSAKGLFFKSGTSKIGDLVIDATHVEVIDYKSTITTHPIETKTAISDHIFKEPLRVKVEGSITDSPIRFMGLFEMPLQANSVDKFISNVQSFLPFADTVKPSRQAYLVLKNIQQSRQLVSVVTKLDSFSDMAIESLSFTTDENTGERLQFSAELVQVVYSTVRTTNNVNYKAKSLKSVAEPKANTGNQPLQQAAPAESRSWLKSFTNSIGDAASSVKDFTVEAFSHENVHRALQVVPW